MLTLRNAVFFLMCLMFSAILNASGSSDSASTQPANAHLASTYVPMESWVYSAFDRLAAEGYLRDAFFDLRPWTRMECARLVDEATELIQRDALGATVPPDAASLLRRLSEEFAAELQRRKGGRNRELRLASLDQRSTIIAGTPLTDGYHFAETLVDDDGRPFGKGANVYTGMAFRAAEGHLAAYVDAELQRVPSAPAPNATAMQEIAVADFTPTAMAGPLSNFTRGRLLEAYVSLGFGGNQLTLGQQTLWWGPARSGSTLFSDNAEPMMMLRYDRTQGILLPGLLKLLGPIRMQFLVGRLAGAQFVHTDEATFGSPGVALGDQPFLHGEKLSFHPTPNLEFGVARTVIFGGTGAPVTTHSFLRSVFSTGTGNENNDPGDRRSAFDAQYRIPGLRKCLTGYFDGFSDDQPFPLAYPTESAWISGFFLRCVPGVPRLTIRAEGLLSPHRDLAFPGFFYFNVHYLSGYTNTRQLMGSWIGREGDGDQTWATWQLSPRSSLEASVRSMTVNREFLQGGALRDVSLAADLALGAEWRLRLEEQTEWWRFPLLSASPQRDAAFTIHLSYSPGTRQK